jgi:hypothetical protein
MDVQFGFRKNCSTIQALKDLLDDKDDSIHQERGTFYAIFIDHVKAFSLLNRCKLFMKLEQMTGTDYPITARIRYVLDYNVVKISDSVKESGYILKTNGVLQKKSFSSITLHFINSIQ